MTTHPTRAWWWELTGGGYRFQPGEPWRSESPNGVAREGVTGTTGFRQWGGYPLYRDTRWPSPRPAYEVGNVIETVEDLERLPVGAGIVDKEGDLAQKRDDGRWAYAIDGSDSVSSEDFTSWPTPPVLAYLPKGAA